MNLILKYQNYESKIIPDELDWILNICKIVKNELIHKKGNIIITNNSEIDLPPNESNFVILSNERRLELRDNNFKKCFLTFYYDINKRYLPFPLGLNKFILNEINNGIDIIPFKERQIDVFFAGCIRSNRIEMVRSLSNLKCKKFMHIATGNNLQTFENDLNPRKYSEIATNSKIMLAPAGGIHQTSYRYFESIFFKTIVICAKSDTKIFFENENPFCHILDTWSDLNDELVVDLVNSYEKKEENFDSFFNQRGSIISAVNYFLKEINKELP